ncbi:hypothetical protein Tco_0656304 [Tanacetum coccineum]|uniref:Reverse transcriptase zinc-binding domain-containing protein n=1 Tax=Tanacetum coccineum TaxID=301880 RepID=A0ABQ4X919_9ASTR
MTWVRWKKCLARKDLGGLGIESIFGLNIGLLFKWIWRFLCSCSDLWERVIKNIYGSHGGINDTSGIHHSTWGGFFFLRSALTNGIDSINLDRKCIDVGSTFCPIFQADIETINHVFFSYVMALDMWAMLARRWELGIPVCANIMEWF